MFENCRCCFSEGNLKNLYQQYMNENEKEVYSDMLKNVYNIIIPRDGDEAICEVCIKKLRNASEFKNLVLDTQKYFSYKIVLDDDIELRSVKDDVIELSDGVSDHSDIDKDNHTPPKDDTVKLKPEKLKTEEAKIEKEKKTVKIGKEITIKLIKLENKIIPKKIVEKKETEGISIQKTAITPSRSKETTSTNNKSLQISEDDLSSNDFDGLDDDHELDDTNMKSKVNSLTIKRINKENLIKITEEIAVNKRRKKEKKISKEPDEKKNTEGNIKKKTTVTKTPSSSDGPTNIKKLENENCTPTVKKTFSCNHCDIANITTANELFKHIQKIHMPKQKVICGECNGVFAHKISLSHHIRNVHMMERKSICKICNLSFYNTTYLRRHFVIHSGERNYECKYCTMRFARRNNLVLHERIHTGDKREVCHICDRRFIQKSSLNYHMSRHHPEEKLSAKKRSNNGSN